MGGVGSGGSRVGAGKKRSARSAARKAAAPKPVAVTVATAPVMVPPDWLSEKEVEQFVGIAQILEEQGRATGHLVPIVAELAQQLALAAELQKTVTENKASYETTTSTGGKMWRARPEVAMLQAARKHAHALLNDLMLTPTSAMRLGKPSAPTVGNRFASIRSGG